MEDFKGHPFAVAAAFMYHFCAHDCALGQRLIYTEVIILSIGIIIKVITEIVTWVAGLVLASWRWWRALEK